VSLSESRVEEGIELICSSLGWARRKEVNRRGIREKRTMGVTSQIVRMG